MAKKLPHAKEWRVRNIEDWNVLTFTEYLKDLHHELFDCDYAPFGQWRIEQGILGDLIGTRGKNAKPRTMSNANVKRFIDETFNSYTPNAKYAGTSLGFMYTYRKNELQRIQAEAAQAARFEKAAKADEITDEELGEWL